MGTADNDFYRMWLQTNFSLSEVFNQFKRADEMGDTVSDWIDFNQKNKPQSNALAGGILLMLISGMQISWIFNSDIINFPWARGHSTTEVISTYAAFYIGALVGLYGASMVINRLTKQNIYFSAMTFVTTGSFFFIAMPKSLYLMLVARVLLGMGHGYAYLTVLVHASEIMTQKLRGLAIASLNLCIISSVLITGSLTMGLEHEKHGFGAMQWIGITGVIFSVLGFIFIPIYTRESPVSLISQKKFDQAVSLMIRLRCESSETWSIKNEYNELKAMIEEDEESTAGIFDDRNVRPLIIITLLKIGSVLSFNFGLNMIRLKYTTLFAGDEVNYTVIILMVFRLVACMVTLFTIDSKGRRPHFLVSYGGTSALLIIMGIVVAFSPKPEDSWLFGILQFAYEIVGGFGMGMISDLYASEAFNTVKKPNSIFFSSSVEFILHVVIIGVTYSAVSTVTFNWIFLVGSGILIMMITVFVHRELPETAKMSIRQTRNEFLKAGDIVFSGSKMPVRTITFS